MNAPSPVFVLLIPPVILDDDNVVAVKLPLTLISEADKEVVVKLLLAFISIADKEVVVKLLLAFISIADRVIAVKLLLTVKSEASISVSNTGTVNLPVADISPITVNV